MQVQYIEQFYQHDSSDPTNPVPVHYSIHGDQRQAAAYLGAPNRGVILDDGATRVAVWNAAEDAEPVFYVQELPLQESDADCCATAEQALVSALEYF